MSLPGIFRNILLRQSKKIRIAFGKDQERIDNDLPLGLRIHGMVSIDETRFLLNDKYLMENPGTENYTIQGIETFKLNGVKMYRAYLASNETTNKQYILEINNKNIALFQIFEEIYPTSKEQWGDWLDDCHGLIGQLDFQIDSEKAVYARLNDSEKQRMDPIHFETVVALDPYGMIGIKTENQCMWYSRLIDDKDEELLFLTCEDVIEDEDPEDNNTRILIMTGITLSESEIKII